MFATSLFPPVMSRLTLSVFTLIQNALMVSGIVLIVGLFGVYSGKTAFIDGLKSFIPANTASEIEDAVDDEVAEVSAESLSPVCVERLNMSPSATVFQMMPCCRFLQLLKLPAVS